MYVASIDVALHSANKILQNNLQFAFCLRFDTNNATENTQRHLARHLARHQSAISHDKHLGSFCIVKCCCDFVTKYIFIVI